MNIVLLIFGLLLLISTLIIWVLYLLFDGLDGIPLRLDWIGWIKRLLKRK